MLLSCYIKIVLELCYIFHFPSRSPLCYNQPSRIRIVHLIKYILLFAAPSQASRTEEPPDVIPFAASTFLVYSQFSRYFLPCAHLRIVLSLLWWQLLLFLILRHTLLHTHLSSWSVRPRGKTIPQFSTVLL